MKLKNTLAHQDVSPDFSPQEIKEIREMLQLSQAQAGEIIGGGPRAFTKYESGTIKPNASIQKLLFLLRENPAMLKQLSSHQVIPVDKASSNPLEITVAHLAALDPKRFTILFQRLLSAEAQSNALPKNGIHVSARITVSDDGEDARIEWTGGPERTTFLPSRVVQFQLKAGPVSPSGAANDILSKGGILKEQIRNVLKMGGDYIMISTQAYEMNKIQNRESKLREAARSDNIVFNNEQISFKSAEHLVMWINSHVSVAIWLLEQTQPGLAGPFRTWSHWANSSEHRIAWTDDQRLHLLKDPLRSLLDSDNGIAVVRGISGLGKSRLCLEALSPSEEEESIGVCIADIILYVDEQIFEGPALKQAVLNLVDASVRAIVVVDRCDPNTRKDLELIITRPSSRLSLLTITDETNCGNLDQNNSIAINEADDAVIEAILDHFVPSFRFEDRSRLVRLSSGNPKMASLLGQSWARNQPLAYATDNELVINTILGRKPLEPEIILQTAKILSVFGFVSENDFAILAPFGHNNLTSQKMHFACKQLMNRNIVQRRGGEIHLLPKPITLKLAEQQWSEWTKDIWTSIFFGDLPKKLKAQAMRQLAYLNTTEVGCKVAKYLCRYDGYLSNMNGILNLSEVEALAPLAEIDPQSVADILEYSLEKFEYDDYLNIRDGLRRQMVRTLERIIFHDRTFEQGAMLLLHFAIAENESWSNNATGQFIGIFNVFLGSTSANGEQRLSFLDNLIEQEIPFSLDLIIESLGRGLSLNSPGRILDPEIQGSSPTLQAWHPNTYQDVWDYQEQCLLRLTTLAKLADSSENNAKKKLAKKLRVLFSSGDRLFEATVKAVNEILEVHGSFWPEAIEQIASTIKYDQKKRLSVQQIDRLQDLLEKLDVKSLSDKLRLIVTEMPRDFLFETNITDDEIGRRQLQAVEQLAQEFAREHKTLEDLLPIINQGKQRMAFFFGRAFAKEISEPKAWLYKTAHTLSGLPAEVRNFDFISGLLLGISQLEIGTVEEFKRFIASSDILAPALPKICWHLGIEISDIKIVTECLNSKFINPEDLAIWSAGRALEKIPSNSILPLFESLLNGDGRSYLIGLELFGMYSFDRNEILEDFLPLIINLASNPEGQFHIDSTEAFHFERLTKWLLDKGRANSDSRTLALTLSRRFLASLDSNPDFIPNSIVSTLLANFPEISWSLIGQAIVFDKNKIWQIELALGDPFNAEESSPPPIVSLPLDTMMAWCYAHPDKGPAFLATTLPILNLQEPISINPTISLLIDEFGENQGVLEGLYRNINTYSWSSSRSTYLNNFLAPFLPLKSHPKRIVRQWAAKFMRSLENEINASKIEDVELKTRWEL